MSVTTDYPDSAPHVAAAAQSFAVGTPLYAKSQSLDVSTFTLGAGGQESLGPYTVGQPGYEMVITANTNSAATIPFLRIAMEWVDTTSGYTVWTDYYIVPMGESSSFPAAVQGRGLSKANQLTVLISNLDPAQSATVEVALIANSRVYPQEMWRWNPTTMGATTVPGYTIPTLVPDTTVLGIIDSATIDESTTATYLFGMAPGQYVQLAGNTGTAPAADVQLTAYGAPNSVYAGGGIILRQVLTTAGFNFQFIAPRSPILLSIDNTDASANLVFSGMMTALG